MEYGTREMDGAGDEEDGGGKGLRAYMQEFVCVYKDQPSQPSCLCESRLRF